LWSSPFAGNADERFGLGYPDEIFDVVATLEMGARKSRIPCCAGRSGWSHVSATGENWFCP
jgi:hypothetical protein